MHTIKRIGEGILWGGIVFLFFIVASAHLLQIPAWLKVTGRMHPMFLHFPIVLLLLSLLSLWIPAKDQGLLRWLNAFRLIAALSAVITAIMGLLLSLEEDRSGGALQWHKWSGITVAFMGFLFYAANNFFHQHIKLGRGLTIFACLVIVFTGHWGATLTHGSNYLFAPLSAERKVPVDKAIVFDDVIKPILENKCFSCHGKDNIKGGLVLDDTIGIKNGGKTGPLYVAGKPATSLLLHRIHLPDNEKKHMPPKAKPQLTEEESLLLYAWIRSGAPLDKKLTSLPVQDSFRILASHFLGAKEENLDQPVYTFAAADNKKIAALNNNFRVLEQPGAGSPAISVHFYGKDKYSSKSLEELLDIKQQIIELSLARMPVKDKELAFVAQMPNLRRLNLNYTDITDKGLEQLSGLKNLQEIALSGTAVKAPSLEKILTLPQLASVYVWNTSIDSVQLITVRKKYNKVHIETGYFDDGQVTTTLSPPMIITPPGIFDQPAKVEMKHPFKGVEIRYTVDGTKPDSANSKVYKAPITIDTSTTILARAFKKGWIGSNDTRAAYIKRGFKPDSIQLITPKDPKYDASANLLSDGDLGDLDPRNGQWLGYRQNEAGFFLYFHDTATVQSLLLNMLQNTGGGIFPPSKVEVWGGMSKDGLKLLGIIKPEIPEKNAGTRLIIEKVTFPTTPVKIIKVMIDRLAKLPQWHVSKGQPGWIFLSEIVVD
ncbi:MAG: chitobiase/beta-hexosaminidase C-terminal domain-containing protein [Chitinophagaceae bacterium]